MNCIIVDDDAMARRSLERLCSKLDVLNVIAVCSSAKEAIAAMEQQMPDLLFLDIEMPEQTGLELLDTLPTLPQIIMTTSKTDYAYDAFNYQVTDYLKKPIDFPRFKTAVNKAISLYESQNKSDSNSEDSADLKTKNVNNLQNYFFFKSNNRFVRISADDLYYFENLGDYVKVYAKTCTLTIHTTMKALDEKLRHPNLVKVHRSYIVNISRIVDIEENSLVIEKKVIPISRAHKPGLMAKLNVI